MIIGAVEAGGTKFVCGIGNEEGVIQERVSFPTERPEETLAQVIDYFRDKQVESIGVGTFGPINIDPLSPLYGYVTTTPKPGWGNYPFLPELKKVFDIPFGWDTDVNAAALGEATWGAAKGLDSCLYYTIGTGVGVGVYAEGKLVHGLVHPEGGHVLTRRHPDDTYEGFCPYHGDCLEGMAAGPALEGRWKVKGSELQPDHPAWAMEAFYIGQAITSAVLLMSPKKVILGGGVMHQMHLFPMIREEVKKNLNGYISAQALLEGMDDYIVPPGLGDNAGLSGSLALALRAL
ncbi:putative fructokinase [Paenibacillus baekrokdamisoli]|uniref:fructokinase n=1 Tax=Paenibacillus baekrokdamisoli TaxID=1712516 RepID=A0A3G9IWN2_9BACL|nr:ROK family protein [Paenibacillus baekrokdamisoli]MBB3068026.1 fructokinase [Paenibacillus baekrokdamisoli]BBH22926.1 putative fructokinase [Paenibacillus baekrokdamisoli]